MVTFHARDIVSVNLDDLGAPIRDDSHGVSSSLGSLKIAENSGNTLN